MPTAVSLHGYRALGLQYGRFAVVGLVATLVHVFVYAASIEWLGQTPLAGNALGFAAGVNVSFLGHRRWTFAVARAVQGPDAASRGSGSWRLRASR